MYLEVWKMKDDANVQLVDRWSPFSLRSRWSHVRRVRIYLLSRMLLKHLVSVTVWFNIVYLRDVMVSLWTSSDFYPSRLQLDPQWSVKFAASLPENDGKNNEPLVFWRQRLTEHKSISVCNPLMMWMYLWQFSHLQIKLPADIFVPLTLLVSTDMG